MRRNAMFETFVLHCIALYCSANHSTVLCRSGKNFLSVHVQYRSVLRSGVSDREGLCLFASRSFMVGLRQPEPDEARHNNQPPKTNAGETWERAKREQRAESRQQTARK